LINISQNLTTVAALERNWEMVALAVAEVDDATLTARPNINSNSMAWLIWHLTRVTDRFIHFRIADRPQVWTTGAWHERFNMPSNPQEFGFGWSNEQAAAWESSPKDVLMAYFDAVNSAAAIYLRSMSEAELDREIPFPALPDMLTVREALGNLVWDNIAHGGQVAYLRGFYQGGGWHR
jgi:hypothetical protein